jgi:hypothetical protein
MLTLAPMEGCQRFERFAAFVERTDSNVLLSLRALALECHEERFARVVDGQMSHWKLSLRMVSGENAAVMGNCCRALTPNLSGDCPNLARCE